MRRRRRISRLGNREDAEHQNRGKDNLIDEGMGWGDARTRVCKEYAGGSPVNTARQMMQLVELIDHWREQQVNERRAQERPDNLRQHIGQDFPRGEAAE